MSTSRSLVTVFGGAGYIGTSLIPHLLKAGYSVRVFDNFCFGDYGLKEVITPDVEVIEGDICDTRAVAHAVNGAEAVILLAALVGRRVEEVPWTNLRNTNFFASSVVLDTAIEYGAHRFIFASSDSVYGVQEGVMYETTIPEPVSLYSRLKLRMEERVIIRKNRYFHPTALRIATCHGYSPRMRFDLVANSLIRDAVCRKELTIKCGEQWRHLVHVDDAARAILSCLKAHENLISGEIFNVGDPDQIIQVNQLANMVKAVVPETWISVLPGEPDLTGYHLSCSKIQKVLDFSFHWKLEESLIQMRDLIYSGKFLDPFSFIHHNT